MFLRFHRGISRICGNNSVLRISGDRGIYCGGGGGRKPRRGRLPLPFAPIDRRDFVYRAAVPGTALRTGAAGAAGRAKSIFRQSRLSQRPRQPRWSEPRLGGADRQRQQSLGGAGCRRRRSAARDPHHRPQYRDLLSLDPHHRHLIFFRDNDGDENYRAFTLELQTGNIVPLTPDGAKSFVQETVARS